MSAGSSRKKARFIALSFSGREMVTSAVPSPRRSTCSVSRSTAQSTVTGSARWRSVPNATPASA